MQGSTEAAEQCVMCNTFSLGRGFQFSSISPVSNRGIDVVIVNMHVTQELYKVLIFIWKNWLIILGVLSFVLLLFLFVVAAWLELVKWMPGLLSVYKWS